MLLIYIQECTMCILVTCFWFHIQKYAMCCNQDYEVKSQSFEMENQCWQSSSTFPQSHLSFCSCWYFCSFFLIQILNVHLRFKSLFRQIQNSVLKFNYAQCVILFAPSHVLFIQLSRNFASFFDRIVSSRAFLGSLILIYFIIY